MEMSLQIERAMALYFQNNIKDAKKILKIVVKQEKQLKKPRYYSRASLKSSDSGVQASKEIW